jgi:biopolymer transport protein ExbD
MNLRGKKKFHAEVSTSSLSDIMFFLMLFFLITSTMISPSVVKLTLPNAKYHQTVNKTEVAIAITKDIKYYVNNDLVTLDAMEAKLREKVKDPTSTTVVLRCDNSVPVQNLIDVMQIGNKMKIKMILATKAPNGN